MTTRDKTSARRGALGKGISSLLGDPAESSGESSGQKGNNPQKTTQARAASAATKTQKASAEGEHPAEAQVVRLPVQRIDPNPQQPRKLFDDSELKELATSLKRDGVLQPVIVAEGDTKGRYILIAGERRWRAAKLAGLETLPAIIKGGVTQDMLRLALIENIQRSDLNIIEEAEAYDSLIQDYGLTQEQCADRVGKERTTVTNALRLLALPREIQDDIMDDRLSMGHGRALLALEDKKTMLRARDIIIKKKLSVRQTEKLCKSFQKENEGEKKAKDPAAGDQADLHYITESLRGLLHTKVKLSGNSQKGKIEISYFSASELERILKVMGHKF